MKTFSLVLIATTLLLALAGLTKATLCDTVSEKQDLMALNYALTLEHLEYAFYRDGLQVFSEGMATATQNFTRDDYTFLGLVRDHERDHVGNLSQIIRSMGGSPVQECTYAFGYGNNFRTFLSIAQVLENTGVSAYTGAIANLTNKVLLTAAATIATVEARHASYFNLINKAVPFPASFDTPLSMTEIIALVNSTGFITSCPTQNFECFGMANSATGVCSGNGVCMGANICVCQRGFGGPMCNQTCTQDCSSCANNQCCNDIRLGNICFNSTTHQCLQNGANSVLCSTNSQACNGNCFDPTLYQCNNGILSLISTSPQSRKRKHAFL